MRSSVGLLVLLCVLASLPSRALAQDAGTPDADVVQAVDLSVGEPAPFDGVLLTEEKLTYYIQLENKLYEANGRVVARDKAIVTLQDNLAIALSRPTGGGFWWGFGSGVAASVLLVWGTAKIID